MPYSKVDDLPSEIRNKLPDEHAQQMFLAAFNGAQTDGMNEEDAMHVGWNSISQLYEQGTDGNWHKKVEDTNIHNKALPSGGN